MHTLGKRTLTAALAALLLLGSVCPAFAADFPDISPDDWYYDQMTRAAQYGIINGVQDESGAKLMAPKLTLTWGQYLAMLTRAFSGGAYDDARAEGFAWDTAGYEAALRAGLLTEDDFLPVSAETLDEAITRQDMAVLLDRSLPENAENYHHSWVERDEAENVLSDLADMEDGYREAVRHLYDLEVTNGKGDGTYGPLDTVQRCDGAVMLMRVLENYVDRSSNGSPAEVTLTLLDEDGAVLAEVTPENCYVGQYLSSLAYQNKPEHYKENYIGGRVSTACSHYTFTYTAMTALEIEEEEAYARYWSGEITYDELMEYDFWLREQGENARKHTLLFGDADKRRFSSRAEAEANMVTVTVPLWRIKNGKKVAGSGSFQIHKAIADDVVAIFTEIYNDPEQFPFNDVGGYGWRGDSARGEHNCGTAIDINWNENYQIIDGKIGAGSFWKPGENQFSITPEGSVVRIFAAHGWSWGGDAWTGDPYAVEYGNHDYMHFSYMGG